MSWRRRVQAIGGVALFLFTLAFASQQVVEEDAGVAISCGSVLAPHPAVALQTSTVEDGLSCDGRVARTWLAALLGAVSIALVLVAADPRVSELELILRQPAPGSATGSS